eukprot:6174803-Pleurochrysis_carterae.AAC.3
MPARMYACDSSAQYIYEHMHSCENASTVDHACLQARACWKARIDDSRSRVDVMRQLEAFSPWIALALTTIARSTARHRGTTSHWPRRLAS